MSTAERQARLSALNLKVKQMLLSQPQSATKHARSGERSGSVQEVKANPYEHFETKGYAIGEAAENRAKTPMLARVSTADYASTGRVNGRRRIQKMLQENAASRGLSSSRNGAKSELNLA